MVRSGRRLQLLFVAHAVVHGLAFQAAWGWGAMELFTAVPAFPATSVGTLTVRLLATLWLLATIGFLAAAMLVARDDRRWRPVAAAAAVVSLAACTLWWQDALAGAALDLVLLGFLAGRIHHQEAARTPLGLQIRR